MTPAPSELLAGRVYSDITDLNAALAEYPQDTLSMAYIKQTMDFAKDEGAAITESIKLPSGNYSKATGYYDFDIMTLDVSMVLDSTSSGSLSFIFENRSDNEYTYGSGYGLFTRKNNNWEPVQPIIENWGFTSEGYTIFPKSTTEPTTIDCQNSASLCCQNLK